MFIYAIILLYLSLTGLNICSLFAAVLGIILYRFYNKSRTYLAFIYALYTFISIVCPIIAQTLNIGVEFQPIINYSPITLAYVLAYVFCVLITYKVVTHTNNTPPKSLKLFHYYIKQSGHFSIKSQKYFLIFIYLISLFSKYYLFTQGYYRFLDLQKPSVIIEYVKILGTLDILVILTIGFYLRTGWKRIYLKLYILIILISPGLGILSGSRMETLSVFLVIFYNHFDYLRKRMIFFIPFIPFFIIIFPVLNLYRGHYDQSLFDIFDQVIKNNKLINVITEIFVDRMNYIKMINVVINKYYANFHLINDYWDNLIGLVPRVFWPEKPIIGIDLNLLGRELGLLRPLDKHTSIGLSVIGESFYELRYFGLTIALLQGITLGLLDKFLRHRSILEHVYYFFMVSLFIITDTYVYILPRFILFTVILFLFGYFINKPVSIPLNPLTPTGKNVL